MSFVFQNNAVLSAWIRVIRGNGGSLGRLATAPAPGVLPSYRGDGGVRIRVRWIPYPNGPPPGIEIGSFPVIGAAPLNAAAIARSLIPRDCHPRMYEPIAGTWLIR